MISKRLLGCVLGLVLISVPALSQTGQNNHDQAFTEPELREIITFYETPTGQKMAAQLPQLMQGAASVGGQLAGAHIADLQRMLQERINQPKGGTTAPAKP